MAHGFEILERLFGGSRRKSREKQQTARQESTSPTSTRRPSSPVFPPPSYLRPTSTHMKPRDAQIDSVERENGRTQSVSTLQEALERRNSTASSVTIVSRPSRSDGSLSLRRNDKDLQPTSRLPRFRFPEDSLFKNERPTCNSADMARKCESPDQSPRTCATEPQRLLDWNPKHLSLLFDPLSFKVSSYAPSRNPSSESTAPSLLPSPNFARLSLAPVIEGCDQPEQSIITQPEFEKIQKKSPDYKQHHPLSYRRPPLYSPPPSESGDEDDQKLVFRQSMSSTDMSPTSVYTACTTPIVTPAQSTNSNLKRRRTIRETWGNRGGDPRVSGYYPANADVIPHSKLRKSASASALSTLTLPIFRERVLKEPTFDDFCALSDDDIAERWPCTPSVGAPPTPPPKNTLCARQKTTRPRVLTSQNTTARPGQEAITPPDTPTDCDIFTPTYLPTTNRDTLGALWAAKLARKYDFAVVYVMSIWPVVSSHSLYTPTTTLASRFRPPHMPATVGFDSLGKGAKITGRLLAAYGLNEVPSPFEIITDTHVSALDSDYWNEYRNINAGSNDISRGWIRPLYSDYVSISMSPIAGRNSETSHHKNRGIVFAAYSKQADNPIIPLEASPEQAFRLGQLYLDAKLLVEALVTQRDVSKKALVLHT